MSVTFTTIKDTEVPEPDSELCPVAWSKHHRRHACADHKGQIHLCTCGEYAAKVVSDAQDADL